MVINLEVIKSNVYTTMALECLRSPQINDGCRHSSTSFAYDHARQATSLYAFKQVTRQKTRC